MSEPPAPIAILGPTASGKTAAALALAAKDPSLELCSVDAFASYRLMDIGTAKPDAAQRAAATWHLLDLVDPAEELSVATFAEAGRAALADIARRGRRALLVGGSGLYLRALVDGLAPPPRFAQLAASLERDAADGAGLAELHRRLTELDPLAASRMEPTNLRRVVRALEVTIGSGRPFSSYGPGLEVYPDRPHRLIGLRIAPEVLSLRLEERLDAQLAAGLLEEVAGLLERPGGLSRTAAQAIGYRELAAHLAGELSLAEARSEILRRSRALARRQVAWLRRDPRVQWVEGARPDTVARVLELAGGGSVTAPDDPV